MTDRVILLSGVVGSTAYGLAGPDSDVDRLGIFAVPTLSLLGLTPPEESHVTSKPDTTLHEAGKAARLMLAGNPTVTELLWLPDDLYEVRTPLAIRRSRCAGRSCPRSGSTTPFSDTRHSRSRNCSPVATGASRPTPAGGPRSTRVT